MAVDLQKLEQKFNALFEDENTVAEFEQWLEARNVGPNDGKPIVMRSLPPDAQAFLVFSANKVNSILSICLRCLDTNELEALRDCLISRTPTAENPVLLAGRLIKNKS